MASGGAIPTAAVSEGEDRWLWRFLLALEIPGQQSLKHESTNSDDRTIRKTTNSMNCRAHVTHLAIDQELSWNLPGACERWLKNVNRYVEKQSEDTNICSQTLDHFCYLSTEKCLTFRNFEQLLSTRSNLFRHPKNNRPGRLHRLAAGSAAHGHPRPPAAGCCRSGRAAAAADGAGRGKRASAAEGDVSRVRSLEGSVDQWPDWSSLKSDEELFFFFCLES